MAHRRRWLGILLAVLVLTGSFVPIVDAVLDVPAHVTITVGQVAELRLGLPISVRVRDDPTGMLRLVSPGPNPAAAGFGAQPVTFSSARPGRAQLDLRLLGLIPLRTVTVDVVEPLAVMPGGHSIGVVIQSEGVRVVALAAVTTADGDRVFPARDAGLRVGDVITRIDGRPVEGVADAAERIHRAGARGSAVSLEVVRAGRRFRLRAQPVLDRTQQRYVLGVWIRDSTTGVGTLTFYHPESGAFGALGHPVVDGDTGQLVDIGRGRIVAASVLDIHRGSHGRPGEKIGAFSPDAPTIGTIERNTPHGIMGRLTGDLEHPLGIGPLPVGFAAQVRPGPAEILTVVRGEQMGRYRIEIERVLGYEQGGKNLVIRVTDPELLELTGGIVQGMSGSPVIQDGRLVGAVTHVFVNDPTRGYAVMIEWMLRDAGLLPGSAGYPAVESRAG
ncbi:MAG: SpoIVB peptidase [Thermaerobacter sp.]|nr:SpoIVB peptidase [Bacillota bacterium]